MHYLIALILSLSLSTPVVSSTTDTPVGDKAAQTITKNNDTCVVSVPTPVDSKIKKTEKKKHKKYVGIKVPEKK